MKNTVISLYHKEMYPTSCFRQGLCRIGLIVTLLVTAGCIQQNDEPENTAEESVYVRIPLPASERYFSLPADSPPRSWITYYEAVLREHNTGNYYTGSAAAGDSFLVVSVIPGKNYDVLVLSGVNVTGQANGIKVLLASGYKDNVPVAYGQQTIIPVQMHIHQTADSFTMVQGDFIYKPEITNTEALIAAQNGGPPPIASTQSFLIPEPDPFGNYQFYPPVTGFAAPNNGTLTFEMKTSELNELEQLTSYNWYYNLTYYAYGDPDSRSSAWSIRRGITNKTDRPMGGGILLKHGIYYVRRNGDDAWAGTEAAPFKTLAKAVSAVRNPANACILGTIVVMGTLDWTSESTHTLGSAYQEAGSVFFIPGASPMEGTLIRITGDPAVGGSGTAVLSGAGSTNRRILYITGAHTRIKLDHITITGGKAIEGGGVCVDAGAAFTMQDNAVIEHNEASHRGGGVAIYRTGSAFTMQGNAVIKDNKASTDGGGVSVFEGVFLMRGNAIIEHNTVIGNAGGGVFVSESGGAFTMQGNAVIKHNQSKSTTFGGGGVFVNPGSVFTMEGDAVIEHNEATAKDGGGVYVRGAFIMQGNAVIEDNTAFRFGGGVYITSNGTFTMNHGILKGNTATSQGSSVYKEAGCTVIGTGTILDSAGQQFYNPDIIVP